MHKKIIYAEDAIEAIRKDMYADRDFMSAAICDGIWDVLKSLPSAQPIPCDVCRYNPPSSGDFKPCTACPAEGRIDG